MGNRDFSLVQTGQPVLKTSPTARAASPAALNLAADAERVEALARLGWDIEGIAGELGISAQKLQTDADLVEAIVRGADYFKNAHTKHLNWRPTPRDLDRVKALAEEGYTEIAVAAKINVSRQAFFSRLNDTPQLKDAFDIGNGLYHAKRQKEFNALVDAQDPDLKTLSTPYIYILKAGGMTDKPESKQIVEGTVKHVHSTAPSLNAPPTVPIAGIADFAKQEMERAKRITAEKLAQQQAAQEAAVEVAVSEVAE